MYKYGVKENRCTKDLKINDKIVPLFLYCIVITIFDMYMCNVILKYLKDQSINLIVHNR